MTDRHALLSAFKRATVKEFEVAGVKFHIRGLTGAERMELATRNKAFRANEGKPLSDAELASWAICSPEGERLYQDAAELEGVDGKTLETIALEILEISGLRDDSKERAAGESPASPS